MIYPAACKKPIVIDLLPLHSSLHAHVASILCPHELHVRAGDRSWWYLCYVPAAVGVPLAQLAWRTAGRRVSPVWQKWSFEQGTRARAVTLVNSAWRNVEGFIEGAGTSFPFLRYIRRFLRETFA